MSEPPPITEQMRAAGREAPDSWLYVLDDRDQVVGAYPVDEHGEVVEPFEPNPAYAPPAPTDALEAALRELFAGTGSREAVLALLRTAELVLPAAADDGLVVSSTPEGRDVVVAYSSVEHADRAGLPADRQLRRGRELARSLPPCTALQVNPGTPTSVTLPREVLLR